MAEKSKPKVVLNIEHLGKSFPVNDGTLEVINDVSFQVTEGELVSIVGHSGCGKSTLFRIIGGLDHATSGKILNEDRTIDGISKNIGMVFQQSRLFPWLKVYDNVAFGISREEKKQISKQEIDARIRQHLELVNLSDFAKAYPGQLSGGMQQRVSIARTLIENPEILLLDEPFSALDAFTRMALQNALLHIREKTNKTMILVTHDVDEAIFLSDRIVVLSERPATVKKIFSVSLAHPRDRSSIDFTELRRQIMAELYDKKENHVEYYI